MRLRAEGGGRSSSYLTVLYRETAKINCVSLVFSVKKCPSSIDGLLFSLPPSRGEAAANTNLLRLKVQSSLR